MIFPDRSAYCSSEVITLKGGLAKVLAACAGFLVKEVTGVKGVVAHKLKDFSVYGIRSRAGGDVNDRPGVPAILGAVGLVINLELLHGVDGWLEGDLVLRHVIQVDAVDHEVDGIFARTGGIERKRSLPAQRSGQIADLGRSH